MDLRYVGKVIGGLSGVSIRVYLGEQLVIIHSVVILPRDSP